MPAMADSSLFVVPDLSGIFSESLAGSPLPPEGGTTRGPFSFVVPESSGILPPDRRTTDEDAPPESEAGETPALPGAPGEDGRREERATTAISANFDLVSVTILFSAALAAAETVTISLDALDGVAYDAVLDVVDVGTSGETSYSFRPNAPIPCESGDEIVVTLSANTLTRTYGCRVVTDTR